jgi:hypothetical protein
MLVAAAVLPHPPLLVPALGRGDDPDVDDLRERCLAAVETVLGRSHDTLFVVGADFGLRATTFRPWGADAAAEVPEPLPLSLLVGGWLTRGRARSFVAVAPDLEVGDCLDLGAELAAAAERVALLVMGDGSARHSVRAPGYLDERAGPYDETVHRALKAVDLGTLAALATATADDLLVAGRAPWQVLAGAADGFRPSEVTASFAAPYGVGYHVVTWT